MATKTCEKCLGTMDESNFYMKKSGERFEMCKKCLTMRIDNFDPSTFTWILEKADMPYVKEEWEKIRDKAFAKNPAKMTGMTVLGKYFSRMRLKEWLPYHWADTETIEEERRKKREELREQQREALAASKEKFERGEISEAEYRTLTPSDIQQSDNLPYGLAPVDGGISTDLRNGVPLPPNPYGDSNPYGESPYLDPDKIPDPGVDLTEDDKIYLAMKWGRFYSPSEWVALESKYQDMKNDFGNEDSDSEASLILISKMYLKMNQAVDAGDIDTFQKLSRTYESVRKSSNLTAVQKKKEKESFLDSVGSLVLYCEQHGGEIPRYDISVPRDIVDTIIKDQKEYLKSLVYEDSALAQQIEDYLKRKEIADAMQRDDDNDKAVEVSDEDILENEERLFQERLMDGEIFGS